MVIALQNINRLQVTAIINLFGVKIFCFYKPDFHGMTLLDVHRKMRSYKHINIKVCKVFCGVSGKYHLAVRAENFFEFHADPVTSFLYTLVEFFIGCFSYLFVVVVIVIVRKVYS